MTELSLTRDIPVQVVPSGTTTIQNSMKTNDDKLFVSTSNDVSGKWMKIEAGDSVKFSTPMYLMQRSWATHVFPVIEV